MPRVGLRTIARLTPGTLLQSVTRLRKGRTQAIDIVPEPPASTVVARPIHDDVVVASTYTLNRTSTKPTRRGWRRVSRAVAKDTFLIGLEALAESADSFPPLKSAVCGLLFFVKQADLVSSNKEQVADIYAQIDAMIVSLVRAIPDVTEVSPTAKEAIRALAEDVQAVCTDMEGVQRQRWSLRFIRARQYSSRLERSARKLAEANASFMRTIATSTEMKSTQILACVQPMREEVHCLLMQRRENFFF